MAHVLLLMILFFIISTLFSMLGIGGGILYVPILLFAGFSIKEAPSISLILIIATSAAALSTFWRKHKVDWKLAALIDPPTDLMAFIGGYFSSLVPNTILKAILIGILFLAGILMIKKNKNSNKSTVPPKRWWRWQRSFNGVTYSVNIPMVLTATGLMGLISGMIGITGGIIKLPIMVLLCGVPMDIAVGTSTVMVAVTAVFGLAGHAIHGIVQWHTGVLLAISAVAGGLLGSKISINVDKLLLKRIFGIVILLIACDLLLRLFL